MESVEDNRYEQMFQRASFKIWVSMLSFGAFALLQNVFNKCFNICWIQKNL